MSFFENADISEPIASRFDILCVIRDEVDTVADGILASFVLNSHVKAHKINSKAKQAVLLSETLHEDEIEALDQKMLRKYVI